MTYKQQIHRKMQRLLTHFRKLILNQRRINALTEGKFNLMHEMTILAVEIRELSDKMNGGNGDVNRILRSPDKTFYDITTLLASEGKSVSTN